MNKFPTEHRVKLSSDFADAKVKGHRVNTASFTFQIVPREGHTRLGLIVSKKAGNSPRRCRIKRLIREAKALKLKPLILPDQKTQRDCGEKSISSYVFVCVGA